MDWRRLLRGVIASALLAGTLVSLCYAGPSVAASPHCTEVDNLAGTCPNVTGTLTSDAAVLTGTQPGGTGSGSNSTGSGTGTTPPPTASTNCPFWGTSEADSCRAFTAAVYPVPTLDDIAAFRPTAGVDHMEPNGWFIVGLDANFYATGGQSVVPGELLGHPARVRFTPIRWQWAYGDGATATKSTRGATWAALGLAEFDPTATSHVYTQPGTYYIDLAIGYRAEYSFNGLPWATITGTLWLPANRLVATVGTAKTVLVERDCSENPTGPGCSN